MNKNEKAAILFREKNYNCSQSVLSVYCEELGLNEELARAVATGFGAGLGQVQLTCGAVTGAIMVLGLKYFDENKVIESKKQTYEKTKEFIRKFEEVNGSIECLRLLGVNLNTKEGMDFVKQQKLFKIKCNKFVLDSCEILDDMLKK